jgi:Bacterial HORMA domain family 1
MTGTFSVSASTSFTITDARYVCSKMGADLGYLNAVYGRPSLARIEQFVEEAAQLLKHGYLATVDYGFKDGDVWKLRLRYRATTGGQLIDLNPGGIRKTIDVTGLSFYSFLCLTSSWHALTETEQSAFEQTLPFERGEASEPTLGLGSNTTGHGYGRNGTGMTRDLFIAT